MNSYRYSSQYMIVESIFADRNLHSHIKDVYCTLKEFLQYFSRVFKSKEIPSIIDPKAYNIFYPDPFYVVSNFSSVYELVQTEFSDIGYDSVLRALSAYCILRSAISGSTPIEEVSKFKTVYLRIMSETANQSEFVKVKLILNMVLFSEVFKPNWYKYRHYYNEQLL